jgi:glycosyltransferase involved in cell wall biosynthesis
MKVVYISGTYAPNAFAGSELSAHTVLKVLQSHFNVDVTVVTDVRYTGGVEAVFNYEEVRVRTVSQADRYKSIRSILRQMTPDIVYTQPWWHDVALKVACELRIPSILRLPDSNLHKTLITSCDTRPAGIVVQTSSMYSQVDKVAPTIPRIILPAFIDLNRVAPRATPSDRILITMFNPIEEKGGFIFREVAEKMPTRPFCAVLGWNSLRKADGSFDRELFRRAYESSGLKYDGYLPNEPDFSDLPNVQLLHPRERVHEIYDQSRIVLFPSVWKEQTGRVILEATANGALVIASGSGTLRERYGGVIELVDDYRSPDAFVERIARFDDQHLYDRSRLAAQAYVLGNYDLMKNAEKFLRFGEQLVEKVPFGTFS